MALPSRPTSTLTYSGEVALVTGAGSGIGFATAQFLAGAGMTVYGIDLSFQGTGSFEQIEVDVRHTDEIREKLDNLPGRVNYLVNCAGIINQDGFKGVSESTFSKVLDINLVAAYKLIDLLVETADLRSVVNITSIEASRVVALTSLDPNPVYSSSKAALRMLTQTAARALAQESITVNAVAPGFVFTPMAADHSTDGSMPPQLSARVPAARFAEPAEIASVVAFLLSDQANYITGLEVVVDGGFRLT